MTILLHILFRQLSFYFGAIWKIGEEIIGKGEIFQSSNQIVKGYSLWLSRYQVSHLKQLERIWDNELEIKTSKKSTHNQDQSLKKATRNAHLKQP